MTEEENVPISEGPKPPEGGRRAVFRDVLGMGRKVGFRARP
jgi:hypothetical protein